jgi:hypothetical protein
MLLSPLPPSPEDALKSPQPLRSRKEQLLPPHRRSGCPSASFLSDSKN